VQDALAAANGLRPVFEPLHPYVSEIGNRYAHHALAPGDDVPELTTFLEEVCAGRRAPLWTKYRRQMRWLVPPPKDFSTRQDAGRVLRSWTRLGRDLPSLIAAARRQDPIVKCIRANLMAGWLANTCGWKVALVVRHPAAVIESELRGAWNATFALDRFRRDATLDRLTGGRYRGLLDRKLKPVEALAVRWVIENQWVVEAAAGNGITVVYYELLRATPEREWGRICAALGLSAMPQSNILRKPSQQSSPTKSGARAAELHNPRWTRALSAEQQATIADVLDEAGVTLYSMNSPDPEPRAEEPGQASDGRAAC
jgi:hypothetical protein